jgi:hypothetical protein
VQSAQKVIPRVSALVPLTSYSVETLTLSNELHFSASLKVEESHKQQQPVLPVA